MRRKNVLSSKSKRSATTIVHISPTVDASDVDRRLLFLAARALDKNWRRRSSLQLQDFRVTAASKARVGLAAIGLSRVEQPALSEISQTQLRPYALNAAQEFQEDFLAYQHELGVTATHKIQNGTLDAEQIVSFEWEAGGSDAPFRITFELRLNAVLLDEGATLIATAGLRSAESTRPAVTIELPLVALTDQARSSLFASCTEALGSLAGRFMDQSESA